MYSQHPEPLCHQHRQVRIPLPDLGERQPRLGGEAALAVFKTQALHLRAIGSLQSITYHWDIFFSLFFLKLWLVGEKEIPVAEEK